MSGTTRDHVQSGVLLFLTFPVYSGQGRTAWSQVTVTHPPYFSGTEVVKFLIDLCNTWRYLLLLLLIINRAWSVHSFEWKLLIQEKSTFRTLKAYNVRRVLVQESKFSWATALSRLYVALAVLAVKMFGYSCTGPCFSDEILDCKTVLIFAYSSTREQSSKRSGARLKTESETGQRREGVWGCSYATLNRFWEKKPTFLQPNEILFQLTRIDIKGIIWLLWRQLWRG